MSKTCSKCGVAKDLSAFHKDTRKADGRRSACAECMSEKKRKPSMKVTPVKNDAKVHSFTSVPIQDLRGIDLGTIMEKYKAPVCLSMYRNKTVRLQVHSVPALTWYGESIEKILQKAS